MLNLAVVFVGILLCCAESVKADSVDDDYATEVEKLFKLIYSVDDYATEVQTLFTDLTSYKSNVAIAKQKMNSFKSETLDRKYAIAIINLYTQDSDFFSELNTEMRNGYPDKSTTIWRRAGDLINRGLDILRPTTHDKVYRGCTKLDTLPVAGSKYSFNQITSTTTSKAIAVEQFSCWDGFLFDIDNVYGVSVEKYSAIGDEREVIIKSTNVFKVKLGPTKEEDYSVYYLDGQPDVNCREKCDTSHQTRVNGANKPGVENISMYTFLVVTILISYEWI